MLRQQIRPPGIAEWIDCVDSILGEVIALPYRNHAGNFMLQGLSIEHTCTINARSRNRILSPIVVTARPAKTERRERPEKVEFPRSGATRYS